VITFGNLFFDEEDLKGFDRLMMPDLSCLVVIAWSYLSGSQVVSSGQLEPDGRSYRLESPMNEPESGLLDLW
jgi:hypothetical protein